MKTCPYCAEEIQDAAIRCKWCRAWLVDDIPQGADDARPPAGLTGRAEQRERPADLTTTQPQPMSSEPMSSRGAAESSAPSMTPASSEPTPSAASTPVSTAAATTSTPTSTTPSTTSTPSSATPPAAETKIEFTHTGSRYLLGYGGDYFGIWDRNSPQQAIERFPRNDQGWAAAWQRYAAIEVNWMDLRTGQKSS